MHGKIHFEGATDSGGTLSEHNHQKSRALFHTDSMSVAKFIVPSTWLWENKDKLLTFSWLSSHPRKVNNGLAAGGEERITGSETTFCT